MIFLMVILLVQKNCKTLEFWLKITSSVDTINLEDLKKSSDTYWNNKKKDRE